MKSSVVCIVFAFMVHAAYSQGSRSKLSSFLRGANPVFAAPREGKPVPQNVNIVEVVGDVPAARQEAASTQFVRETIPNQPTGTSSVSSTGSASHRLSQNGGSSRQGVRQSTRNRPPVNAQPASRPTQRQRPSRRPSSGRQNRQQVRRPNTQPSANDRLADSSPAQQTGRRRPPGKCDFKGASFWIRSFSMTQSQFDSEILLPALNAFSNRACHSRELDIYMEFVLQMRQSMFNV